MSEKRTEQLNIRVTKETLDIIEEEASKIGWSKASLAERILREWTEGTKTNKSSSIQFIITNNNNINL